MQQFVTKYRVNIYLEKKIVILLILKISKFFKGQYQKIKYRIHVSLQKFHGT